MTHTATSGEDETDRLRRRVAELEQRERQRQIELDALREGQRRLRTILQKAPIVVYAIDKEGKFSFVEGHGLSRLGVQPSQLVGQSAWDLYGFVPGSEQRRRRVQSGESVEYLARIGDQAAYKVWSGPLRDESGQIAGSHGVCIDLTDQVKAEEQLREREAFFHALADLSPIGLYHTDVGNQYVFANARALEIVGLAAGQNSAEQWIAALHPDDREQVVNEWQTAIGAKRRFQAEYRFRHPNGDEVWVHGEAVPRLDGDGNIVGAIGVLTDITPLKQAQQQLKSQRDWLEAVAATVPGAIAVYDVRSLKYSFVNEGFRTLLGYDPRELLAGNFDWIVAHTHPDDLARVMRENAEALAADEAGRDTRRANPVVRFEYRMRHADGSWRWVQTIGTVFTRDVEGRIAEVLNVTIDITQRREAEESLRRASQELEERVRQRTDQYTRANEELRREIEQRRASERRLREQNDLLESMLYGMSDGVIVCDGRNELALINSAAERILGITGSALVRAAAERAPGAVGGVPCPAWHFDHRAFRLDGVTPIAPESLPMARALRGETVRNAEVYLAATPSAPVDAWLNVNADTLWGADGAIRGAVMVFRDDTARREAVDALEESLERFQLMVQGSQVGLWDAWINPANPLAPENEIYYSQHLCRLLGYEPHEFGNTLESWIRCVHPDDAPRVFEALRSHLNGREPYEVEYRCLTKQGETRWFAARGESIRDRDGKPIRMSGSFIDITERKRAEAALHEKDIQFKTVLNSTTAIVYIKDLDGKYLFVNRAYESTIHVASTELLGKTDYDLFPREMADAFRANDRQVAQADIPQQFEEYAPHADGMHTYVSVKFPLHDASGKKYATCGISTDITDRKRTEERLRQERQFLRGLLDVNERDRQMMAYDIHDGLVQYITSSTLELESLKEAVRLTDSQKQQCQKILSMLRQAIDDARRVLSGLRPPVLDQSGILVGLQYLVEEQLKSHPIDLRFTHRVKFTRLPSLLEVTIYRIVQEALNNIKKHSEATQADVVLFQLDGHVRLTIRDDGKGFDPTRVAPDRFGLQGICKRASLMGGSAEIESVPGHGATISVTLPLTPPGDVVV